jgi:16S rRNA (guanine527-N7)-methyltransferase
VAETFEQLLAPHAESAEVCAKLACFAELVERWSRTHNLVAFRDRQELVNRHILDALCGAQALGGRGCLLDIGSGAGLPGVPLLIARPGWHGVLLEPRQKRWAFLKLVSRELDLGAEVIQARYQDLGERSTGYDAISVRALTCDNRMLEWARPRLTRSGEVLVWTTEENLGQLRDHQGWHVISCPLVSLEQGRLARLRQWMT